MLKLKEFIAEQENKNDPSEIFDELKDQDYLQMESINSNANPPNVLLMRRVSIRQFPNGTTVALYHIDSLNKYVTVPFGTAMSAN